MTKHSVKVHLISAALGCQYKNAQNLACKLSKGGTIK